MEKGQNEYFQCKIIVHFYEKMKIRYLNQKDKYNKLIDSENFDEKIYLK